MDKQIICKCGNPIFVITKLKDAGKNVIADLKCSLCGNNKIFKKSDISKEIKLTKIKK